MKSRIEDWLQSLLRDTGALLEGHFQLSSGRHSAGYVQCALLLQHPRLARQVGESLAEKLSHLSAESVLAPALGGLLIGHEVAAALDVKFRFTERVGEGMALRRGFDFDSGEKVVVVEDVVTTGRSCLEAMSVAQERGAKMIGAGSILDRTGGVNPFGVPYESLLALSVDTYPVETCPLCAAGDPVVKPGSRPAQSMASRQADS
ncbi:MAG: orotate phosphoribosyltransferase [Thermoanaerobaculia bacterium]